MPKREKENEKEKDAKKNGQKKRHTIQATIMILPQITKNTKNANFLQIFQGEEKKKMKINKKVELLAPVGDMEKLKTAIHFGADAVYFAGKQFGLRAFAGNFEDLSVPISYAHQHNVKAYVTVNIYHRNHQKKEIIAYLKLLNKLKPDGIIVSDIGIMRLAREYAPDVELHISTQANTTSLEASEAYVDLLGAKRVVLARELTLNEITEISKGLKKKDAEVEVFVHGAMCISYSGRCLLSNYLTGRDSNQGACAQPCRWGYSLSEKEKSVNKCYDGTTGSLGVEEDENGTYFLNSKDLCLAAHLDKLIAAGVASFKIEGRMKSPYYLACVVGTYRRLIDGILTKKPTLSIEDAIKELKKSSHREFTTGFVVDDGEVKQNYLSSHQTQDSVFLGTVLGSRKTGDKTEILVEMRNRFKVGDEVELVSPSSAHGTLLKIERMENEKGEDVLDAKRVQEKLYITFANKEEILSQITPLDVIRK